MWHGKGGFIAQTVFRKYTRRLWVINGRWRKMMTFRRYSISLHDDTHQACFESCSKDSYIRCFCSWQILMKVSLQMLSRELRVGGKSTWNFATPRFVLGRVTYIKVAFRQYVYQFTLIFNLSAYLIWLVCNRLTKNLACLPNAVSQSLQARGL